MGNDLGVVLASFKELLEDTSRETRGEITKGYKIIGDRIDRLETDFNRKFESLSTKLDTSTTQVARIEADVEYIKGDITKLEVRFERDLESLWATMRAQRSEICEEYRADCDKKQGACSQNVITRMGHIEDNFKSAAELSAQRIKNWVFGGVIFICLAVVTVVITRVIDHVMRPTKASAVVKQQETK